MLSNLSLTVQVFWPYFSISAICFYLGEWKRWFLDYSLPFLWTLDQVCPSPPDWTVQSLLILPALNTFRFHFFSLKFSSGHSSTLSSVHRLSRPCLLTSASKTQPKSAFVITNLSLCLLYTVSTSAEVVRVLYLSHLHCTYVPISSLWSPWPGLLGPSRLRESHPLVSFYIPFIFILIRVLPHSTRMKKGEGKAEEEEGRGERRGIKKRNKLYCARGPTSQEVYKMHALQTHISKIFLI